MALPITPKPAFPNVPNAPGVPPLLRQVATIQNDVVLLAADVAGVIGLFTPPQWGLYTKGGKPAFAPTGPLGTTGIVAAVLQALGPGGQSVGGIEYRVDHRIATAPQEQGAFLSYNKVSTPFAGRVTYIIGGTASQRAAFLAAVAKAQASTALYVLTMPEYSYPSCTVTHHDFRRTARNGVSMFAVDIWVEEVRITAPAAYSNTQTPAGAAPVNGGTVQASSVDVSPATPAGVAAPSSAPYDAAGNVNPNAPSSSLSGIPDGTPTAPYSAPCTAAVDAANPHVIPTASDR